MLKGPQTDYVITAKEKRITIVCITGSITANGKDITAMQHAKLFPKKQATLNLPDNAICALVSDK